MSKRKHSSSNKKKSSTQKNKEKEEEMFLEYKEAQCSRHYSECRRLFSENEEKCFAIHSIFIPYKREEIHIPCEDIEDDLQYIRKLRERE